MRCTLHAFSFFSMFEVVPLAVDGTTVLVVGLRWHNDRLGPAIGRCARLRRVFQELSQLEADVELSRAHLQTLLLYWCVLYGPLHPQRPTRVEFTLKRRTWHALRETQEIIKRQEATLAAVYKRHRLCA